MKKKLVLIILSVISAMCLCFGLSACDIGSCSFIGDNGGTEHEHSLTPTAAVEATCTQSGNIEYWYCEGCGKYFTDSEATTEITQADTVIAATGHTEVTDEAVAPTCTEAGLTEGKHCSVCNTVITAQEVVAAAGHSWGEVSYVWSSDNSTCTATRTCSKDNNHVESETVNSTYAETAATCTADGSGTYTATFENSAFETQTETVTKFPRRVTTTASIHIRTVRDIIRYARTIPSIRRR